MSECIFCKIINKEINANIVYEDELVVAFEDINPKAKVHVLVIPKKHLISLQHVSENDADILAHITLKLNLIAQNLGLKGGFRTVINTGKDGKQEVWHLHYHLLSQDFKEN